MKVELIRYTPEALELLIGTKSARMRGKDVNTMSDSEKYDHFKYMLDTIKSPFEFVDYVFDISEVSRAFAQQLTRTRTGAYQMETQRALDMSNSDIVEPTKFEGDEELHRLFWDAIADTNASYQQLVAAGAELQDARSILPMNSATRIQCKFNLRTLSDIAKTRLCTRTAGEYQRVFRLMRDAVLAIHPWAEPMLQVACIATGQCAFPRHGKEFCPFWRPWMDLEKEKEQLREDFWRIEVQTNNPVAAGGKSTG